MLTNKLTISKATVTKYARQVYEEHAKKFLTVRTGFILFGVIGLIIILGVIFGRSKYNETMEQLRLQRKEQQAFKEIIEAQKKEIEEDKTRDSLNEYRYKTNQSQRDKIVTGTQTKRDERVKQIFSPHFNDDSIRSVFSNY